MKHSSKMFYTRSNRVGGTNNYPRGQMEKPSDLGSEDFVSSTLTGGTNTFIQAGEDRILIGIVTQLT